MTTVVTVLSDGALAAEAATVDDELIGPKNYYGLQ